MLNKNQLIYFLVFVAVLFSLGCSGSHAIHCIEVESNEICFKREVWGLNGDKVWITENKNVCRKPSAETDYISNALIDGNSFLFKIEGKKLYVFHDAFTPPKRTFPVEILLEHYEYDPQNSNRNRLDEGYQRIELGNNKMTSCLSDIF